MNLRLQKLDTKTISDADLEAYTRLVNLRRAEMLPDDPPLTAAYHRRTRSRVWASLRISNNITGCSVDGRRAGGSSRRGPALGRQPAPARDRRLRFAFSPPHGFGSGVCWPNRSRWLKRRRAVCCFSTRVRPCPRVRLLLKGSARVWASPSTRTNSFWPTWTVLCCELGAKKRR